MAKHKQAQQQKVDQGETWRKQAKDAYQTIDQSYLDLAEALWTIKNGRDDAGGRFYTTWGYEGFPDYCALELGMKPSKANALVRIQEKALELGLPQNRLQGIGWFKASLIANKMTSDNSTELLELAEKLSCRQLAEEMQRRFGGGSSGSKSSALVLRYEPGSSEARAITEVIGMAKEAFEVTDSNDALARVALEWMTWKGAQPEKLPVEEVTAYLGNIYGGEFIFRSGPSAVVPDSRQPEPQRYEEVDDEEEEDLETYIDDIDDPEDLAAELNFDTDDFGLLTDEDLALLK